MLEAARARGDRPAICEQRDRARRAPAARSHETSSARRRSRAVLPSARLLGAAIRGESRARPARRTRARSRTTAPAASAAGRRAASLGRHRPRAARRARPPARRAEHRLVGRPRERRALPRLFGPRATRCSRAHRPPPAPNTGRCARRGIPARRACAPDARRATRSASGREPATGWPSPRARVGDSSRHSESTFSHSMPSNGHVLAAPAQVRLRRVRMRDDRPAAEPMDVLDDVTRLAGERIRRSAA